MDYLLAAVDLGSNSFRLSIGRVEQHNGKAQIYAVDRLKESVQLAAGLDAHQNLDDSAVKRALDVLKRYGERLEGFHPNRVRAVATNTFRVARNSAEILPLAEAALGFPIEVISGAEEARLIYSGVANELAPSADKRLVIDIGGGSTEVILGQGHEPLHLASLGMGCVSFSRKYFPDGRITAQRMEQAMLAARGELQGIARRYRKTGWKQAYGSSGTAKGLLAILAEGGMSQKGITLEGMEKLRTKLVKEGKVVMQSLPGIKATRAPVLPGGLAIMMAAFQELKIDYMQSGEGALRVGVLYDLLGRDSDHDKRDETVTLYQKRYHVDVKQAQRVREIALRLFQQLGGKGDEKDEVTQALGWAASLHEVGLSITQANYYRHSAYILQHAEMPGFSNDDQALLAWLVSGQQGKLKKNTYPATELQWQALLCLRLATLLCRRRDDFDSLPLAIEIKDKTFKAKAAQSWLSSHALSAYSLQREAEEWSKTDFSFKLIEL